MSQSSLGAAPPDGEAGAPESEITPEMIEVARDLLWEHRGTISLDPDFQETLVLALLRRALSAAPSAPNARRP
jgi:hypothetical protein